MGKNKHKRKNKNRQHKQAKGYSGTSSNLWVNHCTHPAIKLPDVTGWLTGGKSFPDNLDLVVALDTWGIPDTGAYDTEGELYPMPQGCRTIYYPIVDRDVPHSLDKLDALLDIVEGYLKDGKNVHIQCIGGHGRTGTMVALLFGRAGIGKDDYLDLEKSVHENYCDRAIESEVQRRFIARYLGLKEPESKFISHSCGFSTKSATDARSYYVKNAEGHYELVSYRHDEEPPKGAVPAGDTEYEPYGGWETERGFGQDWYDNYDRLHNRRGRR